MWLSPTRAAALASVLAAAAALGVAAGAERWGGLVPCALCLLERWPYRIAVVLGLLADILPLRPARWLLGLLVLVLLADMALAAVHVGVEQHAWPSPLPECAAPHLTAHTVAGLLAQMPARPGKPCDAPTYLIPGLPLSMAAMNLIYAALFAGALGGFLWRTRGRPR
jgi:disulfide bond formation protein DsbB